MKYSLGSQEPSKITVTDATRSLSVDSLISDIDYEKTNLTGASGLCKNTDNTGFTKEVDH